jgi:hypothetical protein
VILIDALPEIFLAYDWKDLILLASRNSLMISEIGHIVASLTQQNGPYLASKWVTGIIAGYLFFGTHKATAS